MAGGLLEAALAKEQELCLFVPRSCAAALQDVARFVWDALD